MNRRQALLAFGVATAVLGLVIAFVPGLDPVSSLPEAGPVVLAALAVLAGLGRTWSWLRHDTREVTPPLREGGTRLSVPGDDFDRTLALVPSLGGAAGDQRSLQVREELRDAAVEVLTQYRGYTEAEAEQLLSSGGWTDDRLAAEFFSSVDGTGSSFRESVAGTFWDDEGPFRRRASRAVAAIYGVTGGEE